MDLPVEILSGCVSFDVIGFCPLPMMKKGFATVGLTKDQGQGSQATSINGRQSINILHQERSGALIVVAWMSLF